MVGEIDAIQVKVDYVIYNLWGIKEPNYVMMIMATGGHLLAGDTCKENVIRWNENGKYVVNFFNYKLPFGWHSRYYHAVDDHNNLRRTLT